jgi:5-methylcytosine-specific restriction endonuclease McrA
MIKSMKIGKYFVYVSDRPLRARSAKSRNKAERNLKYLQVAKLMAEHNVYKCELCGNTTERLQMHHLYAVSEFPDKALEQNNTMLVCERCHQRIHNNPYLWLRLIEQRMPQAKNKETKLLNFAF